MTVQFFEQNGRRIAQITDSGVVMATPQDALDLMVNPQLCGARNIIIHRHNVLPEFFDLATGLAGEILQKFVNYEVRLAIVGDYENTESPSLRDFIRESNRGRHVFFPQDTGQALALLCGA